MITDPKAEPKEKKRQVKLFLFFFSFFFYKYLQILPVQKYLLFSFFLYVFTWLQSPVLPIDLCPTPAPIIITSLYKNNSSFSHGIKSM